MVLPDYSCDFVLPGEVRRGLDPGASGNRGAPELFSETKPRDAVAAAFGV
jgi:hypothetical protein